MISWIRSLRRRLRSDQDITEELGTHFDSLVDEGIESGLPDKEARRRAKLRLGDSQAILERVREGDLQTMVESWYRDLILGLRSLRRNPVFAITAILTLGVGIGANTAIFTLLYGLLLRSLPVQDPGALVRLGVVSRSAKSNDAASMPYQMLQQVRRQQRSFVGLSAWRSRAVTLERAGAEPRLLSAALVSGNGFEILGLKPHIGRLLTDADDARGGPAEGWPVVLGYGFWKDALGGDPAVIGSQMKLNNTIVTVVGIASSQFYGVSPGGETKLYLPFQFITVIEGVDRINAPDSYSWCSVIGRLKPGVSDDEAQAELAVSEGELLRQFIPQQYQGMPWVKTAYLKVESARTGLPTFFGRVYSTPLFLMQGLVGIVLLLCCVNIGGLMMSKVYARQQEFAVRTAIGAARWRLIRQYLTESFVVALAGAAVGAAAAWYGTAYLLPFFRHPNEGVGLSIQPDRAVFFVTGFFAIATTLIFGTVPAWRAGAADPGSLLKSRTSGGARRRKLGRAFIPVQVALSFALVSIAMLLSESLVRLETERTGFDLDHVTIQTAPLHMLNLTPEAKLALYHRANNRLNEMPGLISASFTWFTPMTSFQPSSGFQAVDEVPNPPEDSHMIYNDVGPGYFRTMKTPLLAGREFEEKESDRSVCILNQSAAAFLFPGRQPLGRYVRTHTTSTPPGPICRVIGLAQDAKFANLNEAPPRTIYFPVSLETFRNSENLVFLLNASTKAQAISSYRTVKDELMPAIPLVLFATLREQMDAALGSQRALSLMSRFFALLALFLSGLGLYGLLASSVAQRTSEIGVRMALGAERGRVMRMILSEAWGLLFSGLLLGAVVLVTTVQFTAHLLYGVSLFDPLRSIATVGVLAATATIAALVPAIRAASVDPISALRAD